MKPRDDRAVAAWLVLADSDICVAEAVLDLEPPHPAQACFHAQQAAEKALKAVLEADEAAIPRTHDLVIVLGSVQARRASVEQLAEAAAFLADYGVLPRYPTALEPASIAEAQTALKHARSVVAWAKAEFGS